MKVSKVIYTNTKMCLRYESYDIITNDVFFNLRIILEKEQDITHFFNKLKKSEIEPKNYKLDIIKNIKCNLFNNIKFPKKIDDWASYEDLNSNLDNSTKRLYFEIIKQKYNEN